MNIQTPIEVRKALGIRIRTRLAEIPADMLKPIPQAEHADDPKLFNREQFIKETSNFIERVYGYEPSSYQLMVWLLAEEMQTFMDATLGFIESGSEIVVNGKQSPWLKVREIATMNILRLNRELGLTPASRLPATTIEKPAKDVYEVLPFPATKQDSSP
jgi:phage terminase small subunit